MISELSAKNAVACEGSDLNIKCGAAEVISVQRANYGRRSANICNQNGQAPIGNVSCSSTKSKAIVSDKCEGKQSCTIPAVNTIFDDPCVGTYKYLEVDYICKRK